MTRPRRARVKMRDRLSILDAMTDPGLFGAFFGGPSFSAWRVVLKALFALGLNPTDRVVFRQLTGRETPPKDPCREAWIVVGRRGGKSFIAALVAVFVAFFRRYDDLLAPGERGTVMLIAADRRQARVMFRYIVGLIDAVPMLAQLVESRTSEAIHLANRISIEVHTASFRAVRGYTVVAAILDEVAFWRSEDSANPDAEILTALRPAMATVPGSMLLGISSPYARRGVLWQAFRKHHGIDGDPVLVVKAPTRELNPTVPQSEIDRAYSEDPAAAAAEWGAEFRTDVETFVTREAVEACVEPGRRELPPIAGVRFLAFTDPSGGSHDSFTLVIAHRADTRVVLDAIRERQPPFSPESVVEEFSVLIKKYGVTRVVGDRYGGEFPRELFRKRGIDYVLAELSKSQLYGELLAALNSGRVELLDHPKLITQLIGLERRSSRGGRDSIDHAPGGVDDLANSLAGVAHLALRGRDPDDLGVSLGSWNGLRSTLREQPRRRWRRTSGEAKERDVAPLE